MIFAAHSRSRALAFCLLLATTSPTLADAAHPASVPKPDSSFIFPGDAPADCPFPPSTALTEPLFTGRHAEYEFADTWYPSWASDGNLYSPWTDGNVNGLISNSAGTGATTGSAKIAGDDPLNLQIVDQSLFSSDPTPYTGRYPCGSLVYNGVWYYGTYCLNPAGDVHRDGLEYNWPWLGPFVGFRWSTDLGKTWTQTPHTPDKPLFGEQALKGEPVKIGTPHFVDFGKNMEHSPDGKAYLVAHGASDGNNRRYGYNSWITGDEIYLIRVTPTIENMNDASQYEFFAGKDAQGQEIWTHDFAKIKPLAQWRDHLGCVTMTYNAPLKKYLMCVTDGRRTVEAYNTMILESDAITGPFQRVAYWKDFGIGAYFVNFPSKFISADGKTCWLCYAANFPQDWNSMKKEEKPPGSHYAMCLHELQLRSPADPAPAISIDPLKSKANVARDATVTVSSTHSGYIAQGAIDGVVDGFPDDLSHEWASNKEGAGAEIRLTWTHDQLVDRVWLFDRPNSIDQITKGHLTFDDGSIIQVGELADDAATGTEFRFAPKRVKWVSFTVDGVKPGSLNIGLSEFAVFTPNESVSVK
jgi:hypothetical protein